MDRKLERQLKELNQLRTTNKPSDLGPILRIEHRKHSRLYKVTYKVIRKSDRVVASAGSRESVKNYLQWLLNAARLQKEREANA